MVLFSAVFLIFSSIGIGTVTLKWSHELLLWPENVVNDDSLDIKDALKVIAILGPVNLVVSFMWGSFPPLKWLMLFLIDTAVFARYLCLDYRRAAILNILWGLFNFTIAWVFIMCFGDPVVYFFHSLH